MKKIIIALGVIFALLVALAVYSYSQKPKNLHEYLNAPNVLIGKNQCDFTVDKDNQEKMGLSIPLIYVLFSELLQEQDKRMLKASDQEVMTELKSAIKRGCDVNAVYDGYPLLANVVVDNNKEVFELMIKSGADPYQKIVKEKSKMNGKNIFQLSEVLAQHEKTKERQKMNDFVQSFKKDKE